MRERIPHSPRALAAAALALLVAGCGATEETPAEGAFLVARGEAVVLRPDRILDGAGGVLTGLEVVVRDGRIERIDPAGTSVGVPAYDLSGTTLLPGLIDTHVHVGWHFDRDTGRLHTAGSTDSPEDEALYAAANAWSMLRAGFTTVQSLGGPEDVPLRDAIDEGTLPGPRILTSIRAITAGTGDPAAIAAFVDSMADAGADVIKIFASASIRDGGAPTLSQEQLDAACGRASERGLRAVVHAHGPESARRSAMAGCSQIEHGAFLDRPTLELMAERGLYFDPHIHLVFQNYFDNEDRYLGIGNYTEEGFRNMREIVPTAVAAFREALTVPGLEIVFGTDAVAGAHGRNWEELEARVREGGENPMDAIVSATSRAAASLGLEGEIGRIAEGMAADLVAVVGNPDEDVSAVSRVVFVMKGGTVFRSDPR